VFALLVMESSSQGDDGVCSSLGPGAAAKGRSVHGAAGPMRGDHC
jgi:hypothetical protein